VLSNIVDVATRQYMTWKGKVAIKACGNTDAGFQLSTGVNTFANLTDRMIKSGVKSSDIEFLWQRGSCPQKPGEWEIWFIPPKAQFPVFELAWPLDNIHYTRVSEGGLWVSRSPNFLEVDEHVWEDLLSDLTRQMQDRPLSFAYFRMAACSPRLCNSARNKITTSIRQLVASGIAAYRLKIMPAELVSRQTSAVGDFLFPDITLVELSQDSKP
jgi:hypothetical protein